MFRFGLFVLFSALVVACASQPPNVVEQKPSQKPVFQKPQLPDRPLAFGEEYVFEMEKANVEVASLQDLENIEADECLISQMPTEDAAFDNIADFVQQNMKQKWIKPRNINKKYQCDVSLHFSATGCVTEIEVTGCKDNIQLVRSIESALFRSAPFPSIGGALAGDRFQFEFFAGP